MTNEKLNILVAEDTIKHQESARELLSAHTLDVVGTYKEAIKLLGDKDRLYHAVLTDLFLPWSQMPAYPLKNKPEEAMEPRAVGYPLAMFALARGVPHVGIVSLANHHEGAMAATTDDFRECFDYIKTGNSGICYVGNCPLLQGSQNLWFFNASERAPFLTVAAKYEDRRKNWIAALEVMLGQRRPFTREDSDKLDEKESELFGIKNPEERIIAEQRFIDELWREQK